MWICPMCDSEEKDEYAYCSNCAFDRRTDFIAYRTISLLKLEDTQKRVGRVRAKGEPMEEKRPLTLEERFNVKPTEIAREPFEEERTTTRSFTNRRRMIEFEKTLEGDILESETRRNRVDPKHPQKKVFGRQDVEGALESSRVCRIPNDYTQIRPPFSGSIFGSHKDTIERVYLPEGLLEIPMKLFLGCSKLNYVEIPEGVESIQTSAFENCPSLQEISFPDSLKKISTRVFKSCTGLTNVKLPKHLEKMETGAFDGCSSLAEIVIPGSLQRIEVSSFAACKNLRKVALENGVKKIEAGAFERCGSGLHIWIPSSVTSIDSATFHKAEDVTIHCERATAAHQFALQNGMKVSVE